MRDKTIHLSRPGHRRLLLAAALLGAFALRMVHLGPQPLSWDEGWSIGLSTLPWREINRITALDVHPPLYYDLFKLWLGFSRHELLMRFLSVAAGTLVPALAYVTGRTWLKVVHLPEHGELVGIFAAFMAAVSPFLIYYSQVARMFSLCAALSLLATYCLLKGVESSDNRFYLGFVFSAAAAVYTFYYAALVIAAALAFALLMRPHRWRALLLSSVAVALLYTPWLLYAIPPMLARVGSRTGAAFEAKDVLAFLSDGLFGLFFAYGAGWRAVYGVLLLVLFALVLALRRRESVRALLLPILAIVLTLLAVSVGARAHMFAARYLIAASPFLALAIAWAIAVHWRRSPWLGMIVLLLVAASFYPTIVHYVYPKPYEVSGAFDPQADYRFLQGKTRPDDVVFFNVLSLAGLYERFRTASDPPWSYVLRWDPVVEPLEPAVADRVLPAASRYRSLWFVLYKGSFAANLPLKQWLDQNLFPAFGQWREDTLYVQYVPQRAPLTSSEPDLTFDRRVTLQQAKFTSEARAGDPIAVRLVWSSTEQIQQNYKVFVHLYAGDGRLIAQHDSVPMNELRPTWSWQPGESIADNHGLWLPQDVSGPLRLAVGLYNPEDNTRLALPDGSDRAEVGTVEVTPTAK